jgi:glycosyltransferase involved in cell wall biosynthesis
MKISVVIITYNEEKNIGRCIDSVKEVTDDIVVLDSFSTDKTKSIAESKNAKVVQQKFMGYGKTKHFATTLAQHDWILSLDADEALDTALKNEILRLNESPDVGAYSMNRLNNYCGQWIRYGSWYPDTKIRLFNRKYFNWNDAEVHETVVPLSTNMKIGKLSGHILHYTVTSVEAHLAQAKKFATIAAQEAYNKGRKTNIIVVLLSPVFKFLRDYVFKLGFLDGTNGFNIAFISAKAKYWKYKGLYQLQKSAVR